MSLNPKQPINWKWTYLGINRWKFQSTADCGWKFVFWGVKANFLCSHLPFNFKGMFCALWRTLWGWNVNFLYRRSWAWIWKQMFWNCERQDKDNLHWRSDVPCLTALTKGRSFKSLKFLLLKLNFVPKNFCSCYL